MKDSEKENEQEHNRLMKSIRIEQNISKIIEILSVILIIIGEYIIFLKIIEESKFINIISLGAIIATFGAALLAISSVLENDKYNRILTNVDILYRDILKMKPWRRWQFIKRESSEKNLDGMILNQTLTNHIVKFDVGSHEIEISIPTVREDFYDLPSVKYFWLMFRNRKHFKTNLSNKREEIVKKSQFSCWGDYYHGWDCLFDIWKEVMLYKLSRYLLKLGAGIIFMSIFYTISFEKINLILKIVEKN